MSKTRHEKRLRPKNDPYKRLPKASSYDEEEESFSMLTEETIYERQSQLTESVGDDIDV